MTKVKARTPASLRHDSDIEEDYLICEVVGSGTSGVVHRLVNKRSSEEFAGKLLDVSNEGNIKDVNTEVMRLLEHSSESTIQIFGTYFFHNQAWIVLEYCPGGSLYDLLRTRCQPFSEPEVQAIVASVLIGLQALHAKGFAHQDIKASNLLLTRAGQVKLCDFGEVDGTLHWMAPELLGNHSGGRELLLCDVWSLGITILELSTGKTPHSLIVNRAKVIRLVLDSTPPVLPANAFSKDMIDFVRQCLLKDPAARMSTKKLLQHKWVSSVVQQIVKQQKKKRGGPTILLDMLRNINDLKQQQEAELGAFQRKQADELLRREEADQEEIARHDMQEAEEEMALFLALEREEVARAGRRVLRLQREALAEQARCDLERAQRELREEKEERRRMRREDRRSRLANDEVEALKLQLRAEVVKKSEYIGAWNSRYFVVDRTLIKYFKSDSCVEEINRYLITPRTRISSSGSRGVIVLSDDGASPWSLTLNCSDCCVAPTEWTSLVEKCVHYAKHLQPVYVQKRLSFLQSDIRCRGWVEKQSEHLGQMNRRFLIVDGGVLRYFDAEEQFGCTDCRGKYQLTAATTVTCARDGRVLTVQDKTALWSVSFEPCSDNETRPQTPVCPWLSYIRAHIALVS